ncbi:MAG TPA: molybdenum hydroxylase, partial [Spirochaetaceae bacterium]|nr:molybdenum hydroxylase [Spirochaetaceae bacterium]
MGGYGAERVVKAPIAGVVELLRDIGDLVEKGEALLAVEAGKERVEVLSPLKGVVRGIIRSGSVVSAGMKIADVDPRGVVESCRSISDKA